MFESSSVLSSLSSRQQRQRLNAIIAKFTWLGSWKSNQKLNHWSTSMCWMFPQGRGQHIRFLAVEMHRNTPNPIATQNFTQQLQLWHLTACKTNSENATEIKKWRFTSCPDMVQLPWLHAAANVDLHGFCKTARYSVSGGDYHSHPLTSVSREGDEHRPPIYSPTTSWQNIGKSFWIIMSSYAVL